MVEIDCLNRSTREINEQLSRLEEGTEAVLLNPMGRHNIALGLEKAVTVTVKGHAGYYYGGMNQNAKILIEGNAGQGVGENMVSGTIRVKGYASSSAGATARGGLLVIEKDASLRCGISLKGGDIVVGGNVGNMCAFMAQAGTILICGDAGEALGDSLYEAEIYLRGTYKSLGADAAEKPMREKDRKKIAELLKKAGFNHFKPEEFKRIASAKTLYHFDTEKKQTY
jgi:glutamate synthase domain-containing protein 3